MLITTIFHAELVTIFKTVKNLSVTPHSNINSLTAYHGHMSMMGNGIVQKEKMNYCNQMIKKMMSVSTCTNVNIQRYVFILQVCVITK